MRFLKTLTLNPRTLYDDRVALDTANTFTVATSTAMVLPKSSSSLSTVQPEGMIRYNTSTHQVEVYQGSTATWRNLRFKESVGITQQTLGAGDASEVTFGPLNPAPPTVVQSGSSWSGANLIVLVENVFQIHITNYTITQAPSNGKSGTGYWVTFSSPVPLGKPVIVLNGFDQ